MKRLFVLLAVTIISLAGCASGETGPRALPADPAEVSPAEVSLNRTALQELTPDTYQILVVGHLYGGIEGDDRNPAQALMARLSALKESGLSMLVSLGDMVKVSQKADFDELERQLVDNLPFPVFNTPGNHDVEDRALYESRYGQTFYSFRYGPARLIFLDTEREECALDTAQVEMLKKALDAARADADTQQILIFMHKTLFFQNDRLFEAQNYAVQPNQWLCHAKPFFGEIMRTLIEPAAAQKTVTLFAGDVGAWGNLTPYYERRADLPITMVMTGLGDTPSDAGILVTVSAETVQLELYPFTDKKLRPLESYTAEFWLKAAGVK